MGTIIGDFLNIRDVDKRGKPLPIHYIYQKHSRTLYEYTPWENSINPRIIRDDDGLNFLFQR
jgi:hypothetical protein